VRCFRSTMEILISWVAETNNLLLKLIYYKDRSMPRNLSLPYHQQAVQVYNILRYSLSIYIRLLQKCVHALSTTTSSILHLSNCQLYCNVDEPIREWPISMPSSTFYMLLQINISNKLQIITQYYCCIVFLGKYILSITICR